MAKRKDYLSWDEYFMGVAMLSAKRSKDPSTQVGACIVNNENRIMSVGYNPAPILEKSKHIHLIGDANKVGNLRTVIWGAWDVCMKL